MELSLDAVISDRRAQRYLMQAHARHLLLEYERHIDLETGEIEYFIPMKQTFRVCNCGRYLVPNKEGFNRHQGVELYYAEQYKRAHTVNLMTCSSVWNCPVCSTKIAVRRRDELQRVLDATQNNYYLSMTTFTLSHRYGDDLKSLLDGLVRTFRAFRGGRNWTALRDKHYWYADLRTVEIKYGGNGWHPHIHILTWHSFKPNLEQLQADLARRWVHLLPKFGMSASLERGVKVINDEEAEQQAHYLIKTESHWDMAEEMTLHSHKISGGTTPWELLLYSMAGSEKAGDLFKEYARATKGKRMLDWSRSPDIRQNIVQVKTDEELAEEHLENSVFLMTVPWEQWKRLIKAGKVIEFIKIAEETAPNDDLSPALDYLQSLT